MSALNREGRTILSSIQINSSELKQDEYSCRSVCFNYKPHGSKVLWLGFSIWTCAVFRALATLPARWLYITLLHRESCVKNKNDGTSLFTSPGCMKPISQEVFFSADLATVDWTFLEIGHSAIKKQRWGSIIHNWNLAFRLTSLECSWLESTCLLNEMTSRFAYSVQNYAVRGKITAERDTVAKIE